jgi:hypothetical protein
MEVRFAPEVEKQLQDLATQTGRGTDELAQARETLNSRYDDLKSGRVKPIDGEEAFSRLKAKTEAL